MDSMRNPRILIFSDHFAEIALRFGSALNAHTEVCVLVESGNLQREWGNASLPAGLRVIPFQGRSLLRMAPALLSQLLIFRPDIVQFEETTSRWLTPLMRLTQFFAKIVLRVHDVQTHDGRDSRLPAIVRRGREFGRAAADLVLVHGPFCYQEFASRYVTPAYETALGVIHLPLPEQIRRPEPTHVLMFGRLEAYKGLETLTEAMEILHMKGVSITLVIAGRGPELDRLRPRLKQLSTVEIVDEFIPADDVPSYFQRASFIVLPYLEATQSGVAAAAIANHRPVIASRTGGLPDMVSEEATGLLFPPGDSEALAEAMTRLLTKLEDLDRMEAGAAMLASGPLAWDRIVKEMLPVLQRVTPKRRMQL